MSAETQLYAILSADAPLGALVGARIYPDLIPEQVAAPYVGYERTSSTPAATLEGTVLAERVDILIACWANTRRQANQIADAARAALAGTAWRYAGSGSEVDETTGRLAATLQVSLQT